MPFSHKHSARPPGHAAVDWAGQIYKVQHMIRHASFDQLIDLILRQQQRRWQAHRRRGADIDRVLLAIAIPVPPGRPTTAPLDLIEHRPLDVQCGVIRLPDQRAEDRRVRKPEEHVVVVGQADFGKLLELREQGIERPGIGDAGQAQLERRWPAEVAGEPLPGDAALTRWRQLHEVRRLRCQAPSPCRLPR